MCESHTPPCTNQRAQHMTAGSHLTLEPLAHFSFTHTRALPNKKITNYVLLRPPD